MNAFDRIINQQLEMDRCLRPYLEAQELMRRYAIDDRILQETKWMREIDALCAGPFAALAECERASRLAGEIEGLAGVSDWLKHQSQWRDLLACSDGLSSHNVPFEVAPAAAPLDGDEEDKESSPPYGRDGKKRPIRFW